MSVAKAVHILLEGGLVAFATETVYGLGADATNSIAVQKIFQAKGRPFTNPLIVHVADIEIAKRYCTAWPAAAEQLAQKFWPGPLTLVLPKSASIVDEVTAGGSTVGVRVPNHPVALELLQAFGGAVAAPSANRANHISPTSAADVEAELGDAVDLILDGGPCRVGIESTVIELTGTRPRILRPGGISREQIEAVIGPVDIFSGSVDPGRTSASPGQHARHYSPITPTYWFDRSDRERVLEQPKGTVLLIDSSIHLPRVINMSDDPEIYARQLYHTLRKADQKRTPMIYLEMPPDEPRWLAVRDRLLRAAVNWKIEEFKPS